ncbi:MULTISPECIES: hypothetical protein [unclassified Citrobacter]|uniref:hypothetical protein n=1 Tax=unclassified Citrobacter TaxID=2644389 RepID=UPI0020A5C169|nr:MULTISPECIES: hypothetical protein [unclassified Citrobacter]
MLHGIFLQSAPELADDYFKPKVWEDGEGIPRPELMGVLTPDFFSDEIVWNAETGKPERVLVEPELADDGNQMSEGQTEEKMTAVKPLPANYRAASLVLFGPVEEITATQYGQIMDLVNDEESSQARELMEALSREPRVLALLPERQEELLAHLRATVKETAQWTDIKRPINKWLDTPPVKRDEKKPGMSELATRLRYRTAMGKLSRSMDFDVCSPPVGIEMRINTMLCSKDVEIDDWCAPFSRTPGIHDYHPASIVAIIKSADEKLHIYPSELRQYIDSCIAGFDCVNPPQLVIDIACGRTFAPLPQKNDGAKSDGKTEQTLQDENLPPAVCPARAAELNRELDAAFANSASNEGEKTEVTEQEDNRLPMDAREIEIAHPLNDLLSGRTDIMGKEEAEGVVACTGHIIADVLPLLIIDIATTEFCLSPNFNDDEIHDVATTILDGWSDDAALRQKIALDAIVEYRRPEPPKPIVIAPAVVTAKPKKKPELPASSPGSDVTNGELPTTLTYRQQLTLAALQGMCANPAYRGDFDELPHMAVALAAGVISAEAEQ